MVLTLFTLDTLSFSTTNALKNTRGQNNIKADIVVDFKTLTPAAIQDLINYARTNSPCILAIENIPTTGTAPLDELLTQLKWKRIRISKNRYIIWV